MSDRLKLWEQNKDVAMLALAHLLDECDGLEEEPIIMVTDSKDSFARELADAVSQAIEAYDDIEAIVVTNQNGATIQILPTSLAVAVTKNLHRECSVALQEEVADDQLKAAVVSKGGVSILHVPLSPLRTIGSA